MPQLGDAADTADGDMKRLTLSLAATLLTVSPMAPQTLRLAFRPMPSLIGISKEPADSTGSTANDGVQCAGLVDGDDAPAINAAIAKATYATGRNSMVHIAGPVCSIKTTIQAANWSGVHLIGNSLGDFGFSTVLRWNGPPGGTMIDLTSSPSHSSTTSGLKLDGLELDANRLAATCVKIRTLTSSDVRATCDNPTWIGFDIDISGAGTSLYPSTVSNQFWLKVQSSPDGAGTGTLVAGSAKITSYKTTAGRLAVGWYALGQGLPPNTTVSAINGSTLTLSNAAWYTPSRGSQLLFYHYAADGVVIGRGAGISHATADVNSNRFVRTVITGGAGDGVVCGAADGNIFDYIEDTGDAPGSGTTGPIPGAHVGLRLQGSGTATLSPYTTVGRVGADVDACRFNIFQFLGITGRVTVENGALRANGTGTGYVTAAPAKVGAATISIGFGSGTINVGDTLAFSGEPGTHRVLAVLQSGKTVSSSLTPDGVVLASGMAKSLVAGSAVTIEDHVENVYASQNNLIGDLGVLDSFTFLDNTNGRDSTSRAKGDGAVDNGNLVTEEGGATRGYHSFGFSRSPAPPDRGPGAGQCVELWVSGPSTKPPGPAGTCSKIAMCGTSAHYSIEIAGVGGGC